MNRFLTPDDEAELHGVHPFLQRVVLHAAHSVAELNMPWIFRVTDGVRTLEEQKNHVRQNRSKTLSSLHMAGDAVDLAIISLDRTRAFWDLGHYRRLNSVMQLAAGKSNRDFNTAHTLGWGGDWVNLRDGPHWYRG